MKQYEQMKKMFKQMNSKGGKRNMMRGMGGFPNKFGLSCCLDRNEANKDLRITISGRYYKKIKNIDSLRIKVDNISGFKSFIEDSEFVKLMGRPISLVDNFIFLSLFIYNTRA
mgnify:CR=1 FL=1